MVQKMMAGILGRKMVQSHQVLFHRWRLFLQTKKTLSFLSSLKSADQTHVKQSRTVTCDRCSSVILRRLFLPTHRYIRQPQLMYRMTFSSETHSSTPENTFDSILSDANRERLQLKLKSVRPSRKFPWGKGEEVEKAAVLVPLCTVKGEPSFIFTVRSSELNSHRGEVSFPGGKVDRSDTDLVHTALREAHEELGLDPADIQVWGSLLPVPSRNFQMAITPVLAFCGEVDVRKLVPCDQEVASVFTRAIASLCNPNNTRMTQFRSGKGYTLPVYLGGDRRIWGLTAIILHQTLTALAPGLYRFKLNQPQSR